MFVKCVRYFLCVTSLVFVGFFGAPERAHARANCDVENENSILHGTCDGPIDINNNKNYLTYSSNPPSLETGHKKHHHHKHHREYGRDHDKDKYKDKYKEGRRDHDKDKYKFKEGRGDHDKGRFDRGDRFSHFDRMDRFSRFEHFDRFARFDRFDRFALFDRMDRFSHDHHGRMGHKH